MLTFLVIIGQVVNALQFPFQLGFAALVDALYPFINNVPGWIMFLIVR